LLNLPTAPQDPRPLPDLIGAIRDEIHKFVDLSRGFELFSAYYVVLSWIFDKYERVPYARALGPWGSGKTRYLDVMSGLCRNSIKMGAGFSVPSLYRTVDKYRGTTLILDEADFSDSSLSAAVTKILNNGYQRDGVVMRCSGDTFDPQAFSTYGPKVIAARRPYTDEALESRIITHVMSRTIRDDIDIHMPKIDRWYDARRLRNELLGYRLKMMNETEPFRRISLLKEFDPRFREIIYPILDLHEEYEVPEELIDFLRNHARERVIESQYSEEAVALRIIDKYQVRCLLPTLGEIAKELNEEYGKHRYSPQKAGSLLRSLGLKPERNGSRNGCVCVSIHPEKLNLLKKRFGMNDKDDDR